MPIIVDTNVLLVASRLHNTAAESCIDVCNNVLAEISKGSRRIVLDEIGLIANEYGNKLTPRGQRMGDIFLLWLLNNQYNQDYCEQVSITPVYDNDGKSIISFEEFPADPQLANFDLSDRKFVAVAVAHPTYPPILNATDSDWRFVQEVLAVYGLTVEFLCPDLLK